MYFRQERQASITTDTWPPTRPSNKTDPASSLCPLSPSNAASCMSNRQTTIYNVSLRADGAKGLAMCYSVCEPTGAPVLEKKNF